METPLISLLDDSLLGRSSKDAFEDESGLGLSFAALEMRSNRWAFWLRQRGIQPGDRLGFFLANRVEVIDLWLACVKSGVIVVPINILYRDKEIHHILGETRPVAVVTAGKDAHFFSGVRILEVDESAQGAGQVPVASRPSLPREEDPVAALIFTSGTTGAAKGAVLTHKNFAVNGSSLLKAWKFTENDKYLAALPLFHVHGLANGLHCWLGSGCHLRLLGRFQAAHAKEEFLRYRPTVFFGVPTMYVRLLELPEEAARKIGACLRLAVSGSAPLSPVVHEEFRKKFGTTLLERYGMTETLMNTSHPYDGERRPGTVGPALPHVQIAIRDLQGREVRDGEEGELHVKGPNVCQGYWNREDATRGAFVDGWFRTGDMGVRSQDGYITLQGRRSDMIISGGFNIYPREIEEFLVTLPGILEAAVVGVADRVRGELPVAYVVSEGPLDEDVLKEAFGRALASFKCPRAFVRVDHLPRTALGKVQKHLLTPFRP